MGAVGGLSGLIPEVGALLGGRGACPGRRPRPGLDGIAALGLPLVDTRAVASRVWLVGRVHPVPVLALSESLSSLCLSFRACVAAVSQQVQSESV